MPETSNATDHHLVSSAAPAERIRLRERHGSASPADCERAVLFVHGATYPGVMFDVPGASWLVHMADRGFAAYALDVRGYGGSTRGAAMDAPPEDNPPFARAETATADIADAIDFIRDRTGVAKVHLIGWSWGTMTSGCYAAAAPGTIERLVLFAPVYCHEQPARIEAMGDPAAPGRLGPLAAYRTETIDEARERWNAEITADDPNSWRDPAVLAAWYAAMLEDEPGTVVRAPNGVLVDLWEAFNARARYEAGDIEVPTLVIRGTDDAIALRADGIGLYDRLGGRYKQYVEIGRATHFLLLERRAPQLYARVDAFFDMDLTK